MPDRYVQRLAREIDGPFGFMVYVSSLKRRLPWLYEVGMEVHRKASDGELMKAREAFRELYRAAELSGGFLREDDGELRNDMARLYEGMIGYYESRQKDDDELPR